VRCALIEDDVTGAMLWHAPVSFLSLAAGAWNVKTGHQDMAKKSTRMIRVMDEARSVAACRDAFGLEVADRYPFDGFRWFICAIAKPTSSWS
jgi:hypothetical protein